MTCRSAVRTVRQRARAREPGAGVGRIAAEQCGRRPRRRPGAPARRRRRTAGRSTRPLCAEVQHGPACRARAGQRDVADAQSRSSGACVERIRAVRLLEPHVLRAHAVAAARAGRAAARRTWRRGRHRDADCRPAVSGHADSSRMLLHGAAGADGEAGQDRVLAGVAGVLDAGTGSHVDAPAARAAFRREGTSRTSSMPATGCSSSRACTGMQLLYSMCPRRSMRAKIAW
jgi:hypothetical protein